MIVMYSLFKQRERKLTQLDSLRGVQSASHGSLPTMSTEPAHSCTTRIPRMTALLLHAVNISRDRGKIIYIVYILLARPTKGKGTVICIYLWHRFQQSCLF